jgi:hypothetical protein
MPNSKDIRSIIGKKGVWDALPESEVRSAIRQFLIDNPPPEGWPLGVPSDDFVDGVYDQVMTKLTSTPEEKKRIRQGKPL